MTRPAHPWPFPVQPMPAAVEAVAIRAKGNHLVAAQDEPEADEVLTRNWPMPISRHPAIVAGEADARAILRMQEMREKLDDEYASGLDRVGGEWEGDEE